MKKKLLISDIAKELNISITTVSFILNGKAKEKRISDAMTAKVLKLVEEVNYKPNQLAQSLRTGKTKTIGLMVEDISNSFFANIARLIEEKAYKAGYKIIYCSTDDDTEKTRDLIGMFRDKHVDGYIITPPQGVEKDIKELIADGMPVVLLDRYIPSQKSNFVGVDNKSGTFSGTEHLVGQGYTKIAFVTTDSGQSQMLQRLEGYEEGLRQHGLAPALLKIPYRSGAEEMIRQIMAFLKALHERNEIDAVLFATNYLALRGLEAIDRLELKVPAELGVLGFDDHDVFKLYKPTISAIAQPTEAIADQVINIILEQLDADNVASEPIRTTSLATNLIIRNSTPRK